MRTITTHLFPTSALLVRDAFRQLYGRASLSPKISGHLKNVLCAKYVMLTSSGRSALATAISALGLKNGDEIVLQAFTCSVVPAAIVHNSARPVYCDIDPTTLTLSPGSLEQTLTPKTTAAIFQHTFGNASHLSEVSAICNASSRDISLIEDKAHILSPYESLSSTCAIGSFGRTKWLSCVHGGYIATNDYAFFKKICKIESSKSLPPKSWEIYQLLQPLFIQQLVKPYLGKFHVGEVVQTILSHLSLLGKELENGEIEGKPSKLYGYRISPRLESLLSSPLRHYLILKEKREKAVTTYEHNLPSHVKLPGFATIRPYLCYPIYVDDPQELYEFAKRHSIYLGNWYYPALSPSGTNLDKLHYDPSITPYAQWASTHIVNLPTFITEPEAHRIVRVVNSYISTK